ncbi:MAG TPA: hypothetical protein VGS18_00380 [Thermoplasmata archaeon]|nr:hypothetical protein [Thermoplasmata archaeon]
MLGRQPEIEKCYQLGLVNRRALARYLIQRGAAEPNQFDAVLGALRRHEFANVADEGRDLFPEIRVGLKDRIVILDFEKEKALLQRLERLIAQIDYDRGDTFKVVIGTGSIKLFLDRGKERALRGLFDRFQVRNRHDGITEMSLIFPDDATKRRGVLAVIARELAVHDVVVTELLTASPELLIYVRDEFVAAAYEVIRGLQRPAPPPAVRATRSR